MNLKNHVRTNTGLALGHILILLEIHVFPNADQCTHLLNDLNGKRYFIDGLMRQEMIEPNALTDLNGVPFGLTERGAVYVMSLRRVCLPVQKWVPSDEQ